MAGKGAGILNDDDTAAGSPADDVAGALGVEGGPEWTPPAEGAAPRVPALLDTPSPSERLKDVEVGAVRMVLLGLGGAADLAMAKRVGTSSFLLPEEADALAEPVTRIINRRAHLKAMAAQGDLVDAVLIASSGLGIALRNAGEIAETQRRRAEAAAAHVDGEALT